MEGAEGGGRGGRRRRVEGERVSGGGKMKKGKYRNEREVEEEGEKEGVGRRKLGTG